jgi:hypothetical protein
MKANGLFCIIIFFSVIFPSCKENNLEKALRLSGKNRPELERVLIHYKNDVLKLKAAQFLIENMPGHYSYAGNNSELAPSLMLFGNDYFLK